MFNWYIPEELKKWGKWLKRIGFWLFVAVLIMALYGVKAAISHTELLWNDGGFYGNTYNGYQECFGFLQLHRYADGPKKGQWQPVLWSYPVDSEGKKIGEGHPHTTDFTVNTVDCKEVFAIFQAERSVRQGELDNNTSE
jgi:hypothetical protein